MITLTVYFCQEENKIKIIIDDKQKKKVFFSSGLEFLLIRIRR
jgi:hypothetical protein